MKKIQISIFLVTFFQWAFAQQYWQQQADYQMDIQMNVTDFTYKGTQKLTYTNNSPDTLNVVFYHLYFNAFQPNSEMDSNLQSLPDPDRRMVTNIGTTEKPIYQSRIASLKPTEIGYINVKSLTQNGKKVPFQTEGTILKVNVTPILPNSKAVFEMEFDAQVPVMIRRAGRNSPDEVALSMAQWYPKIAAYDTRGWHPTQYLAREFYGVWGNFDVKITIDKNYIIGGTGYLKNKNEIGFGYEDSGVKIKKNTKKTNTWHFIAPNVHDFTWAADPDFQHDRITLNSGKTFHFLYKKYEEKKHKAIPSKLKTIENWKKMQPELIKILDFFEKNIGSYPWEQYSFIQGGDGGMEYAMCTLLAGGENYQRLFGTAVHELAHAWFQHLISTDEGAYAWLDEGFTSFIEELAIHSVTKPNEPTPSFSDAYRHYFSIVKAGIEEPATTHADRFKTNAAYSMMSYSKGTLFLTQLGYIIGNEQVMKSLREYYKKFVFKCPTPNDFIRIAEKVSGMQLQWFLNDFMYTTNTADYAVEKAVSHHGKTQITLQRIGRLPLPVDLFIKDKNGKTHYFYIPQRMQFGEKSNPYNHLKMNVLPSWGWGNVFYKFEIEMPIEQIKEIIIDPENISVDINKENNVLRF